VATEFPEKRARSPLSQAAVRQLAIDAATEKLNEVVSKQADKLVNKANQKADKLTAKTARHLEHLERLAPDADPFGVWTRFDQASRKPRFTRDDIAAAAMRIADAEGFEAVSMRRIAAELDAGTMTLYHYVRTKNELLTLITDALMDEVALPVGTQLPAGWRDAITLIARRSRDALRRHPWVLDISDDPQFGPNGVRHFDQSLQALASLDVDLQAKIDVLMAVDEYVFGFCMHERNNDAGGNDTALTPPMANYLGDLLATGDYPALQAMAAASSLAEVWTGIATAMRDDRRFDRNLDRLLDGFDKSFGR
jgi:AcrR family transcriptional regulator